MKPRRVTLKVELDEYAILGTRHYDGDVELLIDGARYPPSRVSVFEIGELFKQLDQTAGRFLREYL